ncbi:hypothetical protein IWZ01DRAFT_257884 [Phyllosticta capitalensis]
MDEAPDLSFLHRFPVGQGRLILTAPNGSRHVFQHLNMNIIRTNCPLLALSFESSANRVPTADLEVPSIAAGICVIRYIYTKNFGWPGSECDVSMLLTAHVTMLAKLLDQWALYMAANSSLLAKIDFAASFPSPPHDIWATVRFLWTTSVAASNIKESMLNYCVAAFQHHSLGTNPEFMKLCQELIDFHMDLSRVNAQRDYEEPGIFRLPGPNRKPRLPVEEDWSVACAFSGTIGEDADDVDSIIWDDEEDDNNDEEQIPDEPHPLFLHLPVRTKPSAQTENAQTDVEIASLPSPASSEGFVMVDDPFKSTFDSDSDSEWQVVE